MSDLIDYNHSKMPHANGGYKYIMVFVDCFSKKAWTEPLKKKDGFSSVLAIESTINKMETVPTNFVTDR